MVYSCADLFSKMQNKDIKKFDEIKKCDEPAIVCESRSSG